MSFKDYLVLFRAKHYIKNFLIFAPFLLPAVTLSARNLIISTAGFVAFCFLSSAAYIINDIFDCENDKKNLRRRMRPLASGKITKRGCLLLFAVFLTLSVILGILTDYRSGSTGLLIIGLFFIINLIYTVFAKKIPYAEMLFIPLGFALRLIFGFAILGMLPDRRLCLFIFVSALYFVVQKRLSEISLFGSESRKVLRYYKISVIKILKYVCLCLIIVGFSVNHIAVDRAQPLIQRVASVILFCALFIRFEIKAAKAESENTIDLVLSDIIMCIIGAAFVISLFDFRLFLKS